MSGFIAESNRRRGASEPPSWEAELRSIGLETTYARARERINHTLGRATNTFGQVGESVSHPDEFGEGFRPHFPHDLAAVDLDGRLAGT
jgi:hypothetical protein